jgi:hypothetical protein
MTMSQHKHPRAEALGHKDQLLHFSLGRQRLTLLELDAAGRSPDRPIRCSAGTRTGCRRGGTARRLRPGSPEER